MSSLVFRLCDNAPAILRDVCLERGWREYEEEQDEEGAWNLWWKSSGFRTSDFESCFPWQRLNHFPKSNSITRKDSLARNLRRMKGVYGNILFNFAPLSFNLPNDYRKFVTEYSKDRNQKRKFWICKPADQSRGKGIFLFRNLTDLTYDCATVVQQYVQNPLLIAGYKFDIRLYVLVTSFHPLQIYLYHEGIARFGTDKFDLNSLDNVYSHLTNTSINKLSPFYAADKERIGSGCKWSLSQLRTYFHQHDINNRLLWQRITSIVVLTLLMQAPEVHKETTNCFELFGFDVLIDNNLKPWLLEVNFSPSLGIDCSLDITIKKALLDDTMEAINLQETDNSPCSLNGCITKVGTCARNQRSSSRSSSTYSFYSSQSKVNSSSRFYTRSRLSRISPALTRRISKASSKNDASFPEEGSSHSEIANVTENEDGEHTTSSSYQNVGYSSPQKCPTIITEVDHNTESGKRLSDSHDDLINCNTPSCSSGVTSENALEDNKFEGAVSKMSETKELCCCSSQSTCKVHWRSASNLSQSFASTEFRKAFTYSRTSRDTLKSKARMSATSKSESDSTSDATPESNVSEEDNNVKSKRRIKATKLPPIKRSFKKANSFPFVKRSPKIAPYLSTKREIPRKTTNFTNCACGNYSQRWGAHRVNPSKQIGDYILVFPFNEASQKACTSNEFDSKAAIEEVKKVIQRITTLEKNKTKKSTISEEREKENLDLNKPFWGFSSLFNWPS